MNENPIPKIIQQVVGERKAEGRRQMAEGKKGERTLVVGFKPTPERKKFGKRDNHRLLNQDILLQSHVFKTCEPSAF